MIRIHTTRFLVATLAAFALLGLLPAIRADIPGTTLVDTIDPSVGTDAFGLTLLQINHATHKLYTTGYPSDSTRNSGLKVVDTTSNSVIGGIDLGRYSGSDNGFWPIGMDVDESAAPVGDKVYLMGRTDSVANIIMRVVDGASSTNLTGENNGDLFLPVGVQEFASLAVNSSNHKIYVAKANGEIVVVDGPNRQILKTLDPNLGDFLIASPAANKIFVVNHNGGGVINSADETIAPLSLFFTATAAALDSIHGRIYFVGHTLGDSNAIFAVDATTGQIVGSKSGLVNPPLSVTVKPDDNTVYVGSATDLLAFDGTNFASKESLARPAVKLAGDPTVPAGLFLVDPNQSNSVISAAFATGTTATFLTMGYNPFEIAVNSRTNRIYATDERNSELLVIDGSSHAITNRILITPPEPPSSTPLLDRFPRHLAVSERLNRIYVPRTTYDSSVQASRSFLDVIDGETNQIRGSIALDPTIGNYSDRVAVDDTRRRIYVAAARFVATFSTEVVLAVYDADTETRIATEDLGQNFFGGSARELAANPVTGRVYASLDSGLVVVDGNTNTKIGTVSSAGGEIAINRRTNKIYTRGGNGLAVIDGATDSLETSFPIQSNGDYESAFDVDELTNRVYVTHSNQSYSATGRITAYDANNSYQFIGQIDLPIKPVGIRIAGASRQLFVSHDLDGVISVLQASMSAPADLFGNISTRARVGDGDDALIGGFIITGTQAKTVIVRGIGPSLPMPGALADPIIEVHGSSGELLATNDNWKDSTTKQEIINSGLAPTNDLESALWGIINPGAYTVVVRGKNNEAGTGLFEVYDLDTTIPSKLANVSTRGHVGSGDDVMIAGVIVVGSKPVNVILHAIGPSLANIGVQNPLEDPVLELRDPNGGLIASNDDWREHEAEVNATSLPPNDPRESAIVARLFPANYTAIVRGKNGETGVALVDAYFLTGQ
jgi:DNA-binding beta-propeller fold protein YncE